MSDKDEFEKWFDAVSGNDEMIDDLVSSTGKEESIDDSEDYREEDNEEIKETEEEKTINEEKSEIVEDISDWIEVEEKKEIYDPLKESFSMKKNSEEDDILETLLGAPKGEEDEDDFYEDEDEKKSFNEIMEKSQFKGSIVDKKKILLIFGVMVLISVLLCLMGKIKKEQKEKAKTTENETIALSGYVADFGNYKEREYKESEEDKEVNDLVLTKNELEGGNKKEFVQQTPTYSPDNRYEPKNKNSSGQTTQYSVPQSQGSTTSKEIPSSLRVSGFMGNGEYGKSEEGGINFFSSGNERELSSAMNRNEYLNGYMNQLKELTTTTQTDTINTHRYSDAGKYDKEKEGGSFNAIPDNSVYPGTIIKARLKSGIHTDYPGNITAIITQNVYDSKEGKTLLIPQGSMVRGSYSSSSIGVNRVQIAWTDLIINRDGIDYIVNLGSMVGVDKNGYSGIKGTLNDHAFQYVRAALLSCMFTVIDEGIYSYTDAQNNKTIQNMIQDSHEIGNTLTERIMNRALDIQPTVTVKKNQEVYIEVDKVLTLLPFKRDMPTGRYVK